MLVFDRLARSDRCGRPVGGAHAHERVQAQLGLESYVVNALRNEKQPLVCPDSLLGQR